MALQTPVTYGAADAASTQALQEAMRRRYGGPSSSAGIPGMARVADAITPANPIAQQGMATQQSAPVQGAQGFPSGDGIDQLKQTPKGEGETIVKALADRLKKLGEQAAPAPAM